MENFVAACVTITRLNDVALAIVFVTQKARKIFKMYKIPYRTGEGSSIK